MEQGMEQGRKAGQAAADASGRRHASAKDGAVASLRGLLLALVSLPGSVTLFVLTVVSVALLPTGVGALTLPLVVRATHAFAGLRRELAGRWCGLEIPAGHRPLPDDLRGGLIGWLERSRRALRDPGTWRSLLWLAADMTLGFTLAVLSAAFLVYPLEGFVIAAGLWRVLDGYWYGFVPIRGQGTALAAAGLGLVLLLAGRYAAPTALRLHFLLARALISPGTAELERRVQDLTRTRRDAVDTSAAELRRIERDLHDGAQARLVAVGMDLGTAVALIDQDPEKAKEILGKARQSSAAALAELRDLVRGIHPPVLAERGLADAVRALALRLPLPCEVTADLPERVPEPVESAAYFATGELLTNAVKHSGAERIWVDVRHDGRALRVSVTDDGHGGAVVTPGGGLAGVERRLGTFDGVLAVSSPMGGPTSATLEIPCA